MMTDQNAIPETGQDAIDQILAQKLVKVRKKHNWVLTAAEFLVTLAIVFIVFRFVLGVAVVSGDSMVPTLRDGDVAIFLRMATTYDREDVVLLRVADGSDYIKRIVAVGGDTVDIDSEAGTLSVNGQVVDDQYVYEETQQRQDGMTFPLTIPEDSVFVLGDNRTVSHDSRMTDVGCVPLKNLDGRVFFIARTSKGFT